MKRFRTAAWILLAPIIATGVLGAATGPSAQVPPGGVPILTADPPLAESRLTVHTLLREDIFSGFLQGDMTRFARGEKNIDLLLDQRPDQKANLLAWKGGAVLFRAVRAHVARHNPEYQRLYREAQALLSQAADLKTGNDGVKAITGGSLVMFADRLPKADRAAAWTLAYDAYHSIAKQQESVLDKLPTHFRGETLGGLARSAARTGHVQESSDTVDRMLVVLRDTPYEAAARQWKERPFSAANSAITCMGCHESGRLAPRIGALNKK